MKDYTEFALFVLILSITFLVILLSIRQIREIYTFKCEKNFSSAQLDTEPIYQELESVSSYNWLFTPIVTA